MTLFHLLLPRTQTEDSSCPRSPSQTVRHPHQEPANLAHNCSMCPRSEMIYSTLSWNHIIFLTGPHFQTQLIWRAHCPAPDPEHFYARGCVQDEDDLPGPVQGEAQLREPRPGGEPDDGGHGVQVPGRQHPAHRSVSISAVYWGTQQPLVSAQDKFMLSAVIVITDDLSAQTIHRLLKQSKPEAQYKLRCIIESNKVTLTVW